MEQAVRSSGAGRRLAVSGKMASGKDTVARAAALKLGLKPVRINLADAIRTELKEAFDAAEQDQLEQHLQRFDPDSKHPEQLEQLRRACLAGGDVSRRSNSVRVGLQQLAWLARQQDPDVWVRRHLEAVAAARTDDDTIILTTDVREPEEVIALHQAGFLLVRLQVSPANQRRRLAKRDQLTPDHTLEHPNETALDAPGVEIEKLWAAVIDNDGPLEDATNTLSDLLDRAWGVETGEGSGAAAAPDSQAGPERAP